MCFVLYKIKDKSYYHKNVNETFLYPSNYSNIFLKSWIPKHDTISSVETEKAKEISKNKIGINEGDSDLQKVEKVSVFLLKLFQNRKTNPEKFAFNLSPLKLYYAILENKTGAYCTQHSALFTFLIRANGLITRQIGSFGKNDNHIANETYIESEKKWIYTDLTADIIYAKHENKLLSLVEVFTLINTKNNECLNILTYDDSIYYESKLIQKLPLKYFYDKDCTFNYYYETNLKAEFSFFEKCKKYFLNDVYFVEYNSKNNFQWGVYLKYFLWSILAIVQLMLLKKIYFYFIEKNN